MKLTYLLTILLACTLSACSNTPSHLIIAPEILSTPNVHYNNKVVQLSVTDLRNNNYIINIAKKDEASRLFSSEQSLPSIVQATLSKHWQQQGLVIVTAPEQAKNAIDITINAAVINVAQKMVKFSTERTIIIVVKVNNGEKTFTSTFSSKGQTTGVLNADIAALERDFNLHLSNLLQQILSNNDIQMAIK